jgi:hypothetical protein
VTASARWGFLSAAALDCLSAFEGIMDQSGMEIPVTLIIKAPNQKYSDQTISCFLNWTVGKLKTHLSNVYPSKPVSVSSRARGAALRAALGALDLPPRCHPLLS